MQQTQENLIIFLDKAYELTKVSLKLAQAKNFDELIKVLDNRERAINIVQSMSENLSLHQKNKEQESYIAFNNQVNQVIEQIHSMDEIVMACLSHEKEKTQFEIAKTHKNKENFKGYNLNKVK